MNKKLQVFVSSTYTDLIEERQAAVQAILDAGHIPAGMELFKASDESQLNTIYKWIDESDVYMLILGGRYGSVEYKSGKSYTQLEYEYALNKKIPVFAVVLSESFLTTKINLLGLSDVIEQNAPEKYQSFKALVMSKIIREVNDCKDIKINIQLTLYDFMNKYNFIGWTRNINNNNASIQSYNTLNKDNEFIHCLECASMILQKIMFLYLYMELDDHISSLLNTYIDELKATYYYNQNEYKTYETEIHMIFSIHSLISSELNNINHNKQTEEKIYLSKLFYSLQHSLIDLLDKCKRKSIK